MKPDFHLSITGKKVLKVELNFDLGPHYSPYRVVK